LERSIQQQINAQTPPAQHLTRSLIIHLSFSLPLCLGRFIIFGSGNKVNFSSTNPDTEKAQKTQRICSLLPRGRPMILTNDPLQIPSGYLNIMGYIDESEVNGPGSRAVVWMQGCKRECQGCFNPASWSFEINQLISVDELADKIISNPRNQGVTFSGGEPFFQAIALAELAKKLKASGLSAMSFSGFTLQELQREDAPPGAQDLLAQLDILIDGPYIESLAINSPDSPVSSRNQRVHIFNPAFGDKITWASDQIEIHILQDGTRLFTGFRGQMGF
jgi:anaerobic ribonucleoside-triphosphate reductase activating protein